MGKCFGVIGGDRRQAELARLLEADGYQVQTYGLEAWRGNGVSLEQAASAEAIILPLPLCKGDGVLNCPDAPVPTAELFRLLTPRQLVLAGQVLPGQQKEAEERGLTLVDYFRREEVTVANAAITAEAALQVAMEHLDRTLLGTDCLVLGFGRIGKLLSFRLHGLGVKVTAAARKPEDRAWIRAFGWKSLDIRNLDGELTPFGAVFNTVPSPILEKDLLAQLPAECVCVDLASQPGIDIHAAQSLGLDAVWARSLPGRLAPAAAAAVLRDAVYYILKERGDPV